MVSEAGPHAAAEPSTYLGSASFNGHRSVYDHDHELSSRNNYQPSQGRQVHGQQGQLQQQHSPTAWSSNSNQGLSGSMPWSSSSHLSPNPQSQSHSQQSQKQGQEHQHDHHQQQHQQRTYGNSDSASSQQQHSASHHAYGSLNANPATSGSYYAMQSINGGSGHRTPGGGLSLGAPGMEQRGSNGASTAGGSGYSTPSHNGIGPSRSASNANMAADGSGHRFDGQHRSDHNTYHSHSTSGSTSHSPMHTSHASTPVNEHTAATAAASAAAAAAATGAGGPGNGAGGYRTHTSTAPSLSGYQAFSTGSGHSHSPQHTQSQAQGGYFGFGGMSQTFNPTTYTGTTFNHTLNPAHSTPGLGVGRGISASSAGNGAGFGMGMGTSFTPTAGIHVPLPGRHRVTTTLWEDESTLCFQVDAKGVCVARRHDNNMVNGTKLLNVCGMSRGKRDGILKNEKERIVVKVGAMHLKGVWIEFGRAKQLAEQNHIAELLYPLFEPNIQQFLYHPENLPRTAAVLAAAQERQIANSASTGGAGLGAQSPPTSGNTSARQSLSGGSAVPPPLMRASTSPLAHRNSGNEGLHSVSAAAWATGHGHAPPAHQLMRDHQSSSAPGAGYSNPPSLKLNGSLAHSRTDLDDAQRRSASELSLHSHTHAQHDSYAGNISMSSTQMNGGSATAPPVPTRRVSGVKRDREGAENEANDSYSNSSIRNSLSAEDGASNSSGGAASSHVHGLGPGHGHDSDSAEQISKRPRADGLGSLSRSSSAHSLRQSWTDPQRYQQQQQPQQQPLQQPLQPQPQQPQQHQQHLPSISQTPPTTFYYSSHGSGPSQLFHHQQ